MTISFNTSIPSHNVSFGKKESKAADNTPVNKDLYKDLEEIPPRPKRRGPIKYMKDCISSWKKFGASAKEYTTGTIFGTLEGILGGGITYGIISFIKNHKNQAVQTVKEGAEDIAQEAGQVIKKSKSKAAIAGGIIVGLGILAINLWNSSLKADHAKAEIDHSYKKTPIISK